MNGGDNPYGSGKAGYTTNVSYGSETQPEQPVEQPAESTQTEILIGDAPINAGGELIKDTTTSGFTADVIEESRNQPVIVDFWAPWCGPCKQLQPALEKVVRQAGGAVKLVKLNIDDHPAIPGQMGVQSIPAVFAFKDGQPVDGFMGAVPESQIHEFVAKLGTDGAKDRVAEAIDVANTALKAEDFQSAGQMFSAIVQQHADNADALGGLAAALYGLGELEQAKEVLESVGESDKDNPVVAAVRARIALAEQVADLGDPDELKGRLDADPKDHQARFDLAGIQNALGKRQEAADNLLEIIRLDRGWNEEAARKQLLQFFEAWGADDDVTLAARRGLSAILFS
ncbi:MAG: thioredoxin [Hyphomicrobiales bacterium]|nr:thioredoxin [Hyphomicrobiales bacterium]